MKNEVKQTVKNIRAKIAERQEFHNFVIPNIGFILDEKFCELEREYKKKNLLFYTTSLTGKIIIAYLLAIANFSLTKIKEEDIENYKNLCMKIKNFSLSKDIQFAILYCIWNNLECESLNHENFDKELNCIGYKKSINKKNLEQCTLEEFKKRNQSIMSSLKRRIGDQKQIMTILENVWEEQESELQFLFSQFYLTEFFRSFQKYWHMSLEEKIEHGVHQKFFDTESLETTDWEACKTELHKLGLEHCIKNIEQEVQQKHERKRNRI